MRGRRKGFTTKNTKGTKGNPARRHPASLPSPFFRHRRAPSFVIACRGFDETAGGSGNFVPARAGLDLAIHAPGLSPGRRETPGSSPGVTGKGRRDGTVSAI